MRPMAAAGEICRNPQCGGMVVRTRGNVPLCSCSPLPKPDPRAAYERAARAERRLRGRGGVHVVMLREEQQ